MTRCPQCRQPAPSGARFCAFCGIRLSPDGSPEPAAPARAAESAAARADLPGERKHVTVLFADVTASMSVLTSHDAEEAAALFDRVVDHMIEAVRRWEGTVTQHLGDGIMALFGAPLAHEDHAIRACYAALRMQERITAYGDAVQRAHGIPIQIRVGLNSGEVVLRPLGPDPTALSAVGQTVHLASRMEQLAKPGTILATGETAALAGGRVRTRPLGPVNVKGLTLPLEVFEVTGSLRPAAHAEPASRALPKLVGRERELRRLDDALAVVEQGPGQIVAITGEPGIGKSRLLLEFLRVCRARCAVFGSAAEPYTRATGQRTGLDIIRSYFGLDRTDPPPAVREKVARAMRFDPELALHVPAMLWQLSALEDDDAFFRLDAATRRQRGFEANFRLIGAEARRQPFVLVLENLQWVDTDAEDSLRLLAKGLTPFTLVLVTYRPEYVDDWILQAGGMRLHLDPLGPATARDLLDGLVGGDPALDSVKKLLIERTGGNPFFLEESVRDLVQSGALVGERGQYRLDHAVTEIHVPPTVRSVLEARIDRLPPLDKRVLQCAAVIGLEVPGGLLEAVTDLPPDATRGALGRLRYAEFLEAQAVFPEPAYAFRHSLTHDVAYGSLLNDRRRALHGRVLEALERLEERGPSEIVESLAHHAMLAEAWESALAYARRAGKKARAGAGERQAAVFFEQALAALGHLPDDPAHRALAVDLREELARVLVPLGEHPRMVALLREAEAIAASLGDRTRLARTRALLCYGYWETGDSAAAIEVGERAVAVAREVGAPELIVVANFGLGGAVRTIGDYERAVALLGDILPLVEGERAAEEYGLAGPASVLARGHLAWSLAELGRFAEAVARADEAIRLAQVTGRAFSQAHAHLALGGTLMRQGRFGEAIAVLERGLVLTRDAPFLFAPMAGDLGVIYTLSGRAAAGLELAERAVATAERMGRLGRLSLIVTHLGEACLFAGRPADAAEQAARALALAVDHAEGGNQVYAHHLIGLIAAEADPPRADEARQHLGEALGLAERLGMRPLAARCQLALGRLARRLGDAEGARRRLGIAIPELEAMGMKHWLERQALEPVSPA